MPASTTDLFPLGIVRFTTAASNTLPYEDISLAMERHRSGDWGDGHPTGKEENDDGLRFGGRLFSVYHDRNGTEFWIITESDRSVTTVLLPDDY